MRSVASIRSVRMVRYILMAGMVLVAGCASSFSAQLSRYQQWPADTVGARYWIDADAGQKNNLQFQTYADSVRAAIGVTGMVEAQSERQARFILHMEYGSPRERGWAQRAVDPYIYPGPFGFYGGMGGFHRHGWWGGGYYGPMVETVPVEFYRLTLEIRITDKEQAGKEVYRAKAVANSSSNRLDAAMPYLARAVFDRFPGHNGQEIEVRYPLQ